MEYLRIFQEISDEVTVERLLRPVQRFMREEAASGVLLLAAAVTALAWANSPWSDSYERLWETHLTIGVGSFVLEESLHFWINDALMVVFFFVVGLEIKRALVAGELASPRRALLPVLAAVGGMVLPALLYTLLNFGGPGERGWGIPMATDIAFSLGVLALLGRRVPLSLKVFLTAFAIVDDIGAVAVIALFYTEEISLPNLGVGLGLLAVLLVMNRRGAHSPLLFALVGVGVWLAFLKSGVHTTVSGVLAAMLVPAQSKINAAEFIARSRAALDTFERAGESGESISPSLDQRVCIEEMEASIMDVETPLQRIEHSLHRWVAFGIMPLFALANAGVSLSSGAISSALAGPVALGIFLGLVVGKQGGIFLCTWLGVRSGLVSLPPGLTWRHIYGVAWLGGIGFTMSLFISALAFQDPGVQEASKVGILLASLVSGVGGVLVLMSAPRSPEGAPAQEEASSGDGAGGPGATPSGPAG